MTCQESLHTQSYLDGELDGADAKAVERHIESCAQCQALAAQTADLSDALRRKAVRHRAPEALRVRLAAALDRETARKPVRGFWYGAASGTGLTALAAGFALFVLLPPDRKSVV